MSKITSKIRVIFGIIYTWIHIVMLIFMGVFIMLAITTKSIDYDCLMVLIAVLGIYVGNCIRISKFGVWRILVFVLSVFLTFCFLTLVFYIPTILK